jgi:hypothetical protein
LISLTQGFAATEVKRLGQHHAVRPQVFSLDQEWVGQLALFRGEFRVSLTRRLQYIGFIGLGRKGCSTIRGAKLDFVCLHLENVQSFASLDARTALELNRLFERTLGGLEFRPANQLLPAQFLRGCERGHQASR